MRAGGLGATHLAKIDEFVFGWDKGKQEEMWIFRVVNFHLVVDRVVGFSRRVSEVHETDHKKLKVHQPKNPHFLLISFISPQKKLVNLGQMGGT